MTTWTPIGGAANSWTQENTPIRVFSRDVFSHASFGGKFIFSMNPRGGVWDKDSAPSTTWTRE